MNEPTLGDILRDAIARRSAAEQTIRIPEIGRRMHEPERALLKNSIRKFYNGDRMTNREVQIVLDHLTAAYNSLQHLGERFDITRESLLRDVLKIEGWARSRNDRRTR